VKEMTALVGMHGKARFSTRGVVSETELTLLPGAPAALDQQVDSTREWIRQIYTPFPEEEVGKGATWEVTARVPISGAMMDSTMVFTLVKVDSSSAQTSVETSLSALPNQPMPLPTLPPGATATLGSLTGSGAGKTSPSFSRLVGTSTNKMSMDLAMDIAMQSEKLTAKMHTEMIVSMRPGKAAPSAAKM
jgi:hypothetical protein